ncbi:MAG TPA: glutamate racemase [Polyangia bacterium]|nr:glutamate racemase [Polyangia bacterium]
MIGVFDSGFGGLTVLSSLLARLPAYDYLYLGDSARAPYGSRSHDAVYRFTREAAEFLFDAGCPLVILACNTSSARALRTLQQRHLPARRPDRRILGVVRPSAEALAGLPPGAIPGVTEAATITGTVGVLGTTGTVISDSYRLELAKLAPNLNVVQQACPMWVPLIEADELEGPGVDHYVRKYLDPLLAAPTPPSRLLLACTHYPLLLPRLRAHVPDDVALLTQGDIVAERLEDWLRRHPEMERRLGRGGARRFVTTEDAAWFQERGSRLFGRPIVAQTVRLPSIDDA